MKKYLIPLLLALFLVPAVEPTEALAQSNKSILVDGDGNAWRQIMTAHNIRDAALSAGDSLHKSDRGLLNFLDLTWPTIDSVSFVIRSTDSLKGRLLVERPNLIGTVDTVGLEIVLANDKANTLTVGWFELNKLFSGTGALPAMIDAHLQVHTYGTTYAGAAQVATEKFDIWLVEHRSSP